MTMVPRVVFSSRHLFVAFISRWEWRLRGDAESWWFGFEWDAGHVAFPAREAREPCIYLRVCGVEITVWL